MSAARLKRAFNVLIFVTWTQRMVWCQYYAEELGDSRGQHNQEHDEDHYVKPLYKFGYWVHDPKSKDVKNHWEHRDGDVVHGAYSLLQPDGHVRVVEYTADKHRGFNAHVKYMTYGALGSGGDEGGANDVGAGFNRHSGEESAAPSRINDGGGRGGGHPKQHLLRQFYKKPQNEKPGGPAGHYDRNPGGRDSKKQRNPTSEKSAERFTNDGPDFDAFSKFSASVGGANYERHRHHGSRPGGGRTQYDEPLQGAITDPWRPSERFSREQSSSPLQTTPLENAIRYSSGGIQTQSSEPISSRRQPDDAASAERSDRSDSLQKPRHPQQQPPSSYRSQRSHNDEHGASDEDGDGEPQRPVPRHNDDDHDDDESRSRVAEGDAKASEVDVQKQPLREFHFEEPPPYPFELPENVRASVKYRPAPTRKRHALATVSSAYFPGWYGTAAEQRPVYSYY